MKLVFATDNSLDRVLEKDSEKIFSADVLVFGFNGLGLVSYKKELAGETDYFHDVSRLSAELKGVVICGCDTDSYGYFHHSAVIADSGKILGVSDEVHQSADSEFSPGGSFRVYDTSAGKIGIIVGDDLYFPEVPRVLSLCDADIIICIQKKVESFIPQIMLRAGAFSNGVTMALVAKNYACVSDIKGNVSVMGKSDIVIKDVKKEKDYRLVSLRRRGIYKEFGSGY